MARVSEQYRAMVWRIASAVLVQINGFGQMRPTLEVEMPLQRQVRIRPVFVLRINCFTTLLILISCFLFTGRGGRMIEENV
jgi:hypothetical protein